MNLNYSKSQVGPYLHFELVNQPEIDFTFSSINDYITGLTRLNVMTLYVNSVADPNPLGFNGQWDLSVKAVTAAAGFWDSYGIFYSNNGSIPPVDILHLKVRNVDNTPQIADFFPIQSTSTYLIGSTLIGEGQFPCGLNLPTNVAGSYKTLPQCYKFNVDYKITPGLPNNFRLGYYKITVEFTLSSDL